MKTLFHFPFIIYAAATLASLCIMIIVDYVLGAKAEHLNAWVIVNRLFGRDFGIGDSLAIRHFGLWGAAIVMILVNTIFGVILMQLIKTIIRFFTLKC